MPYKKKSNLCLNRTKGEKRRRTGVWQHIVYSPRGRTKLSEHNETPSKSPFRKKAKNLYLLVDKILFNEEEYKFSPKYPVHPSHGIKSPYLSTPKSPYLKKARVLLKSSDDKENTYGKKRRNLFTQYVTTEQDESFDFVPLPSCEEVCNTENNSAVELNVDNSLAKPENNIAQGHGSSVKFENEIDEMTYIMSLIPSVVTTLRENGLGDVLPQFFKSVADGRMPLDNIAFLLWIEVLRWFNLDNTTAMRYSEDTKKFWKLGYRLFGGKFVRYMSGFKHMSSAEFELDRRGYRIIHQKHRI